MTETYWQLNVLQVWTTWHCFQLLYRHIWPSSNAFLCLKDVADLVYARDKVNLANFLSQWFHFAFCRS